MSDIKFKQIDNALVTTPEVNHKKLFLDTDNVFKTKNSSSLVENLGGSFTPITNATVSQYTSFVVSGAGYIVHNMSLSTNPVVFTKHNSIDGWKQMNEESDTWLTINNNVINIINDDGRGGFPIHAFPFYIRIYN